LILNFSDGIFISKEWMDDIKLHSVPKFTAKFTEKWQFIQEYSLSTLEELPKLFQVDLSICSTFVHDLKLEWRKGT
jgi:hypothetical protein